MVGIRVVEVLGLMWQWLETEAGVLSAAGCWRRREDSDSGCLREGEPASRHRAVHRQQLSNLGNQPMGKGTFRQ